MRDSLFFQTVLPRERLAVQVYLFVTGTGAAGYNVSVWGPGSSPLALLRDGGRVPPEMDFDDFSIGALHIRNDLALRSATVTVRSPQLSLDLQFVGMHDAFTFHDNPDGLPRWFADDRIEQTGSISGSLAFGDTSATLGPIGHRDHSWGLRDWNAPQHWKWLVAYTPSGRAVNGWIWQAHGEWGFAGYVLRPGSPNVVPVTRIDATTSYSDDAEQQTLEAIFHDVEGGTTLLELSVFGILHLPDERSGTTILEGASEALIDGEPGAGQFEAEWPTEYFRHLGGRA